MQRIFLGIAVLIICWLMLIGSVLAVENQTEVSESTESGEEATPAAITIRQTAEKRKESDLTQPEGPAKSKLQRYLEEQKLGPLSVTNFLQHAIHSAAERGVPVNTVVLILLFPLVAAIIAASRHLIGLRGFGIFTPAVVSVGFLATGLTTGLFLFGIILIVASVGRILVRSLRLLYLPRVSLILWFVSLAVLFLLLAAPYFAMNNLLELSIFPTLLLVLLAEEFIDVQSRRGMRQAAEMTLETLLLATVSYLVMNLQTVQRFVLLNPEITVVSVGLFNLFLGRFMGLRLLEHWRFKTILHQ